MARNQTKEPTEREPFDPIATHLHIEKRKMPSPMEPPPDWRIAPAGGINDDGLTGERIEPANPDLHGDAPIMLYLHGGSYFFCSSRTHRPITTDPVTHARVRVCVSDYRLAPEHPFPVPVEDALFTYRTLVMQGVLPSCTVVVGNSADDGLALALLVVSRDAADSLPTGAVLCSPWTDLAATSQGLIDNDESDVIFRGARMVHGAVLYLGDSDAPADHPLASPLCVDFTGLPTLHCYVSTSKVLHDDTLRMAEQARATRVSVSMKME